MRVKYLTQAPLSGSQWCSHNYAGFYIVIKVALSLPYPSKRFTTPQTPKPAPSPMTSVCNVSMLVVKNSISFTRSGSEY